MEMREPLPSRMGGGHAGCFSVDAPGELCGAHTRRVARVESPVPGSRRGAQREPGRTENVAGNGGAHRELVAGGARGGGGLSLCVVRSAFSRRGALART